MLRRQTTVISDSGRSAASPQATSSQAGDWHDATAHHRYQLGLQRRRANRRNPSRAAPAIGQPVRVLIVKAKGAAGCPVAPQSLHSLVQALERPLRSPKTGLAGDPSEVTALGKRHWITSFRC
jgi:hypothetical protein